MAEAPRQRNARACEACRASKTRCIYKSDVGDCQRCKATGSQCVVRTKARPGRTRAVRLSTGSTKSQKSGIFNDASEFALDLPTVVTPDTSKNLVDLQNHHKEFFEDDDPAEFLSQSQHGPIAVEKRQLLTAFRQRAASFPFVHIPAEATVPSLARQSPFLLLSILTVASIRDPPLCHQLDHEFRRVLSLKVVIEGRKSLDFLQGLLIYIAWYPIHVSPKNNQSFMYMSLAISLVEDLGLDRETPGQMGFTSISREGLTDGDGFSKASKRAYLGCYYLSSSLSMGFQKANNMHYRNLMDSRGESLLQDEDSPDIYSIVKLQRLSEKVAESYSYSATDTGGAGTDPFKDEVNIQIFYSELQDWRRSTTDLFRNLPIVCIAEKFVAIQIYSHQLGFFRRPYRLHLQQSAGINNANPAHLTSCLEACKKFFEYLLSLPEVTYTTFSVVQWAFIVQGVLVLSRLTFLVASTLGWDSETTRSNIPLVMYLDALCYRFQSITSTPQRGADLPKNPDAVYVMKKMLESVRKSYERRVAKIEPGFLIVSDGNAIGIATGHCPMMDPTLKVLFDEAVFTYDESFSMSATPASNSTSSTIPLYHDLWATMTGSWANEI